MDLSTLKKSASEAIKKAKTISELDSLRIKYLGRQGEVTGILRSLKDLSKTKRAKIGQLANQTKKEILSALAEQKHKIVKTIRPKGPGLDVTRPGVKIEAGHLHPISLVSRQTEDIFQSMGFSIIEGPEIETEWYNFDALNIPKDHPARDLWDTFWLRQNDTKNKKQKTKNTSTKIQKLLLRTHTSPVQIRYMEKNQPPLRIIVPGRCFRHEATDASHDIQFHQLEGLMVDKEVSVANFKAIIQEFFQRFFGKPVKIRLRPSFFPFTEPSFEVDMSCVNCHGKGCSVCSKMGWLEMMGAGMVNPAVFKAAGLNPRNWQGFAFGIGIDRLAMMKYKINDIRLFYKGDLRFLKQF